MVTIIPRIAFVVARGANGVIGADGDLPWRLSSDLQRFKAITLGKPVIMGRKTWESLPRRPLPGRLNIVITRQADYQAEGACVVPDPGEALKAAFDQARQDGVDEVCVIGGAQIYGAMMNLAERLYLTEVEASPPGDARLPEIIESEWHEVAREAHPAGERDDHAFVLRTLERA